MVVEDEPDVLGVIDLSLRLLGKLDVVAVANFAEALEAIGRRRPDVILLDRMLPDLDGLEGCRRLKADPDSSTIPIVFLSARSDPADVKAGLAAGADGYLTKPFDPVVLSQHITAILKDRDEHAGQTARKAPRGRRRRR
ncbi:MAG TPA: response regulator [Candidatus Eremiobacteraceae bacterium]